MMKKLKEMCAESKSRKATKEANRKGHREVKDGHALVCLCSVIPLAETFFYSPIETTTKTIEGEGLNIT